MRILHISSALIGGGAETQLKLLMRGLVDRGHEVGIVYLYDDPSLEEREGIEFFQVPRGPKMDLIGLYRRISTAIDKFKPDAVHTWLPEIMTIPGALHCRWRGIPCVSAQRRSLRHAVSFKNRLRDWLVIVPHILARSVVCNFDYAHEPWLLRKVIDKRHGTIIRNGFVKRPVSAMPAADWARTEAFKLLYVGRLVEQKRVDLLVQAVGELRESGHDLQLVICGTGPDEVALRKQALDLKLREGNDIVFLGYRPDWHSFATFFDLFVLPSVAEGMPNVLVEAMGLGLPTIATSISEISSFVKHEEQSLLVEPNNLISLKETIERLIEDTDTRKLLSANGKDLAASLSIDISIAEYVTLYQELLRQ